MEIKLPNKYSLFSINTEIILTRDTVGYFKLAIPDAHCNIDEISMLWLDEQPMYDAFGLVYKDINFVYDQRTKQFVAMSSSYKPRIGEYAWVFTRNDWNNFKLEQSPEPTEDLRCFDYIVSTGEAYRTVGDNPEEYRDYGGVWISGVTQTED
jgi:hypothetical protein